jgi:CHAT domain-containing protein/tetratricopeptide (TPR) repeat protein
LDHSSREHIGTAELAKLLEELRERSESMMDVQEAHPHLAACMSCREQFEGLAMLDRQLKSARPTPSAPGRDGCPGPSLWREIAGGLTPPEETLARVEHASRCGHCGPLLHHAVAELAALNGEMTEAERRYIATLESARTEWQRNLAQRMAGTRNSRSDRESVSWWQRQLTFPRLAIVGGSLLAVIGVGLWVPFQRNRPAVADRLIARAYTEKRTLELRIAGASYAPLRISRGPAASFTSSPPPLLKAEALIAGQLESHYADPAWLQAEGQADLLEGKYDAAVEALHRALELDPNSPAILTDLATGYFQRALQEEHKDDFGAAFECLSQVLNVHPDDPVALFNRAIVSEHQFLYQQALDDWDHYLRVDSNSQWAEEARNRAAVVREKLKLHSSKAPPLLSPTDLTAAATVDVAAEFDGRVEEYLHEAIRSWLPQAFPVARSEEGKADPSATKALFVLADITSQRHGDQWLSDLLSGSSAPRFSQAAAALARSVQANDAGGYDISLQQADLAERLFRASGNMAGVFRAQFERAFAAQLTRRSEACRRQARAALQEALKYSYPWLQIQLGLENGVCSGLMNDRGAYDRAAQRAMAQAQKSAYGGLYLRALGFAADFRFATGAVSGGSKLADLGLERFWSAPYPAMRGYNLYSEVAVKANAAGQANLQVAAWQEALTLVASDPDPLLRAWAHRSLANAAVLAHRPQVAERNYAEAVRLFTLAPRTDASRNYALENEIRVAELEGRLGRFEPAIVRLTAIQDQVRTLSNDYLAQMFYSTLGELELGRHRSSEAKQALRPALALAEKSLATLNNEEERTDWSKTAAPVYLALSEAELVQGDSQDALEIYEWYLGAQQRDPAGSRFTPSSYRSGFQPAIPGPSQLESRLPMLAKETVLTYAVLPDGLAIWVYDNRGLNARWIPKATDGLQDLAARFRDLTSDPKSEPSAVRRDARSLYESLIAPVEQYLEPGRTLVIETEGWLAGVAFEALLDSRGHYLIERAPLVHSPGGDSQTPRDDTRISANLPALVVGSTASSSVDSLVPLPDVVAEADTVAGDFHPVHVLEGRDATLRAVESGLPQASVFHFAGHSLATAEGTGLMLESEPGSESTPGLMDAIMVGELHLQNLQLAVLSACSTASSSGGASGFNSITDALLRAGVPHVVASRWPVDSAVSRKFVEDFYTNLLSGEPVPDSIRRTSLRMLSNPQISHPYYWAAFAAYGQR